MTLAPDDWSRILDRLVDELNPQPDPEQELYWWGTCDLDDCDGQPHEQLDRRHARPNQMAPPGDWLIWLIRAGRGWGKALALDTPLPTPEGWTTMGDVQAGDWVLDEQGIPCMVTFVTEVQRDRECYRVWFDDGSCIVADSEHLWQTWDKKARKAHGRAASPRSGPIVRTTAEIAATLTVGSRGERNHSVQNALPLQLCPRDLIVDPYLFGFWLGDGSSRAGEVTIGDQDADFVLDLLRSAGAPVSGPERRNIGAACATYPVGGRPTQQGIGGFVDNDSFHSRLRRLGVLNRKHIPNDYLRAAHPQRLALLQGLMDSDGSVQEGGHIEFLGSNRFLAEGVHELAISLGYKATMVEERATLRGAYIGPRYRVSWTTHEEVFRLPRKLARLRKTQAQANRTRHRYITAVEPVASVPVKCITVDSPSHLYLAGKSMIPTHNTRTAAEWAKSKGLDYPNSRIALVGASLDDVRDTMIEGEALALDTLVPTPTGYKTMGELQVGDVVFGGDGWPCTVTESFPVLYDRPCYRVQLKGGIEIVADAEHKWLTEDAITRAYTARHGTTKRGARVVTTAEMSVSLYHFSGVAKQANHGIAVAETELEETDLPLDPYILGAWLGDGTSKSGVITTADPEILSWFELAGFPARSHAQVNGQARAYGLLGLQTVLRGMGLLKNKHVPMVYLRSGTKQRLALLQGLMDTDGYVSQRGQCEFVNKNKLLAEAVVELACSLGIKASAPRAKSTKVGTTHWIVKFTTAAPVFRLERKLERQVKAYRDQKHWYVKGVEPTTSVPVRCIAVDSPDRTFLVTRHYIRTHNSGMLACLPPSALRGGNRDDAWNRSMCELFLANGTKYKGFSSQRPDKLRGPQHHFAWVDEIATLDDADRGPEEESTTISNLLLGLRLGVNPQMVVTGTPKRKRVLIGFSRKGEPDYKPGLLDMPGVVETRGSTYDNLKNLAATFKNRILSMYEGTRTGAQELMAEMLEDVEGALWKHQWFNDHREAHRVWEALDLVTVVVAVDPALTSGPQSDETGIVVVGIDHSGHLYVLADRSCRVSPHMWAQRIVKTYNDFRANYVVCEKTAGDLLVENLEAVDASMPVRYVGTKVGKRLRAQPVVNLYEQGKVHHMSKFMFDSDALGKLESQMTEWIPGETSDSPDRVDALVHGCSALAITGSLYSGETTVVDTRLRGRR